MTAKFVHAVDTRYTPARKVKVPEQHLDIFPYLKRREDKKSETRAPRPAPQVAPSTSEIIKGGK